MHVDLDELHNVLVSESLDPGLPCVDVAQLGAAYLVLAEGYGGCIVNLQLDGLWVVEAELSSAMT